MLARLFSIVRLFATLGFIAPKWRVPCFAMFGVFAGLGLVTAHVSRAVSYMSDAPESCSNCHVMHTAYGTWQHSSHANVATCTDCHVPHDSIINKYAWKARDGMYHSTIFTLRLEPQVIQMSSGAVPVVEANCRRCHDQVIDEVHLREWQPGDPRCWDCHREVPHGRTRSLSTVSRIMAPQLPGLTEIGEEPRIGGRAPRPDPQGRAP